MKYNKITTSEHVIVSDKYKTNILHFLVYEVWDQIHNMETAESRIIASAYVS